MLVSESVTWDCDRDQLGCQHGSGAPVLAREAALRRRRCHVSLLLLASSGSPTCLASGHGNADVGGGQGGRCGRLISPDLPDWVLYAGPPCPA